MSLSEIFIHSNLLVAYKSAIKYVEKPNLATVPHVKCAMKPMSKDMTTIGTKNTSKKTKIAASNLSNTTLH